MLNFKAYKLGELQNFLSMLNQCETRGVVDIRFVREKLHNFIAESHKENRIFHRKMDKKYGDGGRMPKCPSCGKRRLQDIKNTEGLLILGCSKCRYSEIINTEVLDV